MRSELPEISRIRHHWIILFRPPPLWGAIGLALIFVWAVVAPAMFIVLIVLLATVGVLRWRSWRAELIILTQRRIIRSSGLPETTSTEASLRVDRISGAVLTQTVPGKILGYGTIELEAPGSHPDVRKLIKIETPVAFYGKLRAIVFADHAGGGDPEDRPPDYVTERLPRHRQ